VAWWLKSRLLSTKPALASCIQSPEEAWMMATSPLSILLENVRQQLSQGDILPALEPLQNYLSAGDPDLLSFLAEVSRRVKPEMSPGAASATKLEEMALPEQLGLEDIILPEDLILGINNLKQISWIEQGLQVARSVCRLLTPKGLGNGFLIAPDLLMTNNHVLASAEVAGRSQAEFNYQLGFGNKPLPTCRYHLDAGRFHTSADLDYTIVGVVADPNKPALAEYGHLTLNPNADPVPGEHVVIIQHPNGGLKQIVLTANQVLRLAGPLLHYTTDTMPGSSGSPVFNDQWEVIAIHHAGGVLMTNSKGDKRFVNEGVLMSAIRPAAGPLWPQ
jgi:V8-like Glu-specific endopeptidase